ncbi:thiamine pyrophosphate-dependent enzyme [Rhodococcus sp. NPDC058514]|uniref:thiamine pyrophosphate-dependent enzyme n=1 Tax=unclassified Rhodococcus (in: high G+C Gram-positive bacteria) TaxID=192944 RepID=UPI003662C4AB
MAEAIDELFVEAVAAMASPTPRRPPDPTEPVREGSPLTVARCLELFDAQLGSRHLDLAARWLRARGAGFYTIGSSGHEGNAAVAGALRATDPALLHYRSGGFFLERARQVGGGDPLRDVLLGVVAAADDPISGGRHKVFGRHDLAVIPQTSTIASHLPRALGVAFSIARTRRLGVDTPWPADAVAVCSFGDASVNHSTAVGAINAATLGAYEGLPLPLLLVCEDNGIGVSVPTPDGWIEAAYSGRVGLEYLSADGCDLADAFDAATRASDWVRAHRRPAFLHLRTVRLMGHAGSDVESAYRSPGVIAAEQRRDPLLGTARLLVGSGALTPAEVLARYERKRDVVFALAGEVAELPRLTTTAAVMTPLREPNPESVADAAGQPADLPCRAAFFDNGLPEAAGPLTLAQAIKRALLDALAAYPEVLVFGEDVARKGGVYGVTRGLAARAGQARVFDTPLDEQTVLGLALGAAVSGLLPIAEVQYLAYLHNAEDQIRGEAATLGFFSSGRYRNPMVVRVAGYGYQKGFGGHFHNDDSVAVLRDVPGLVVASPARPDDAAAMLRTCVAAAKTAGAVCVFLEPIALYHERDLHESGDGGWLAPYAGADSWAATHVPIGSGRTYGDGPDLTIVTFGNGLRMSLRVVERLRSRGIGARVFDLRWLAPLPAADLLREAGATGRVLVVDETRRSGGVSEGVIAALVDAGFEGRIARVTSEDSFVPLGEAARLVLVSEEQIEEAAVGLVGLRR